MKTSPRIRSRRPSRNYRSPMVSALRVEQLEDRRLLSISGSIDEEPLEIWPSQTPVPVQDGAPADLSVPSPEVPVSSLGLSVDVAEVQPAGPEAGSQITLAAPALGTTIEAVDFDSNATNNGSYHIPPDPIAVIDCRA